MQGRINRGDQMSPAYIYQETHLVRVQREKCSI